MAQYWAIFLCAVLIPESAATDLPVVDIGYTLHRAADSSTNLSYYDFRNIQYATAERFGLPEQPVVNRTVGLGNFSSICPQASPDWIETAEEFLAGRNFSGISMPDLTNASAPSNISFYSEDCLHLDVQVPKSVFSVGEAERVTQGKLAPVVLWLHGGGFVQGTKADDGNGAGLISQSLEDGNEGIVYVAANYRLGIFGWLSDGGLSDYAGVLNAGLLDQVKALEWIRQYIHLFGGDARRVTILGESSGAGAILHHLAALTNSHVPSLFHYAILQSPFTAPLPSKAQQNKTYQHVLDDSATGSFAGLRSLSSTKLQEVNAAVVAKSTYGTFTFGPVVDGGYVKGPAAQSLQKLSHHRQIPVLVGHNAHEGTLFADPLVQNDSDYVAMLLSLVPDAMPGIINKLTKDVYPSPVASSTYSSQMERVISTMADILIDCNVYYIEHALLNSTYSYLFSVPSGLHAVDLHYTFYGSPTTGSYNATVARALQLYISSFAATGVPHDSGTAAFPLFKYQHTEQNLNITGIAAVKSSISNHRCLALQEFLWSGRS